jgi:hypothetical protein
MLPKPAMNTYMKNDRTQLGKISAAVPNSGTKKRLIADHFT